MDVMLALVGFGEAGSTFARAAGWGNAVLAWDIDARRRSLMADWGVLAAEDAKGALRHAPMVLSLVTADAALAVAQECAPLITGGAIWCDMNSVAPQTKRKAASAIEAAGGRYADVAVLAPVDPMRMNVPLLVSGTCAAEAAMLLRQAGFADLTVIGAEVGQASAVKMIRSVMVKGIEALTAEMILAADAAGVTDRVLASLDTSEKSWPWAKRAAYNLERMATHGLRRAAEMEEAVKTLEALGVAPVMTRSTVERQRSAVEGMP